ncbi:MAG: sulfite exporter TauE/SafE family protein [Planctomycetaceae bacterium]
MAFGSYVAGSTPMGGGTVGFPVLVLLFDHPGALGRNFAFSIQSIGMVSASIYILSSRQSLNWNLLKPTLIGSLLGTPFGAIWVTPLISDLHVKLTFAVVWFSFGLLHLMKLTELIQLSGINQRARQFDISIGLILGFCGGLVASITGVGIDMMIYAVLVLLYRADLKTAIPTSVLLMAFTSLVGLGTNLTLSNYYPEIYHFDPEVFNNWIAAAPVVALGAPLGALVVTLIPRTPTLLFVSLLCIVQFFWTIYEEQVQGLSLFVTVLFVLIVNLCFHFLYRWGKASLQNNISRKSADSPILAEENQ